MISQNPDIINDTYDYIFGKIEKSPFEEINQKYQKSITDLRKKADKIATAEKHSYLGKSRRGVKSVIKVAKEVSQELSVEK